ncbi:histamine H1 receptor-like [Centruroides sculpturatus]|uniref:histamine H1 receptor-like n=1 Tax=Centruroides sculpturatus TaxID=218467 RepID=UPI000C6DE20E|nr:histamine H1 receptor-like [Centruroides sculpturatus]
MENERELYYIANSSILSVFWELATYRTFSTTQKVQLANDSCLWDINATTEEREAEHNLSLDITLSESSVVGPPDTYPNPGYLANVAIAVPMGISLYTLSLLTFVGNAMVLHAIRTERRLQTVSNMFIMSLAIADLTVGMFVMPISSAYAITGDWKFGIVVCQFWLSADYSASTASILNLLILSLDRYWSIRSPLKYIRKRTKKRALVMIAIVWLVSAMWIIPIIGWHYWYNDGIRKQPDSVCETEFADNVFFKLTTSTANFYVPMVLMICLYVKIFSEIKKRSQFEIGQCNVRGQQQLECRNGTNNRENRRDWSDVSFRRTDSRVVFRPSPNDRKFQQLTLLTVQNSNGDQAQQSEHYQGVTVKVEYVGDGSREEVRPVLRSDERVGGSFRSGSGLLPNLSTAIRMKVTRRTITNLRQEKKAARQLGVIMGAFVLCWLPYIITFMVTAYCEDCINPDVHTATIWLGYLNSTMNPFLYALCNANFKRAFKKLFCRSNKAMFTTSTSSKPDQLFA